MFIPVHRGHALVETNFGGKTSLTCVAVVEIADFNNNRYDHSHCEELYEPGELPAIGHGPMVAPR
jgi:hypothetical protein